MSYPLHIKHCVLVPYLVPASILLNKSFQYRSKSKDFFRYNFAKMKQNQNTLLSFLDTLPCLQYAEHFETPPSRVHGFALFFMIKSIYHDKHC